MVHPGNGIINILKDVKVKTERKLNVVKEEFNLDQIIDATTDKDRELTIEEILQQHAEKIDNSQKKELSSLVTTRFETVSRLPAQLQDFHCGKISESIGYTQTKTSGKDNLKAISKPVRENATPPNYNKLSPLLIVLGCQKQRETKSFVLGPAADSYTASAGVIPHKGIANITLLANTANIMSEAAAEANVVQLTPLQVACKITTGNPTYFDICAEKK